MISALVPGSSGPGSTPGRGHCVFFLGQTLNSHTVLLSTQEYKWVPGNCWEKLRNSGGVTCDGPASTPGEVEILLAASYYRNWDKVRQLQSFTYHIGTHQTSSHITSCKDVENITRFLLQYIQLKILLFTRLLLASVS